MFKTCYGADVGCGYNNHRVGANHISVTQRVDELNVLCSCKEIKGNTRNMVLIADTTWTNVKALPGPSNTWTLPPVVIYEAQGQER